MRYWLMLISSLPMAWLAMALGFSLDINSVWMACVYLLIAPVLEEYVFRAQLQQALRDKGCSPLLSISIASSVFAACHAPWLGGSAVWFVLPGAALGLCWQHYGSLWRNALLHSAFNVSLVLATRYFS